MRPIPKKIRDIIAIDPFYKSCCRRDDLEHCDGRLTIEHVFTVAGRQINDLWQLLPLCEFHHSLGKWINNGGLNKKENRLIAFSRAKQSDLDKYPKATWYA